MSHSLTDLELNNVLLDVRNAYRLLFLYQKRVLDLMKFIGNHYSLSYKGGWSKYSNSSPKNGKGSLDNWAWDWLNMYCYEFHFGNNKINEDQVRFSIILQSDTGRWLSDCDKRDVNKFSTAEASKSRLFFLVGKNNKWEVDSTIKEMSSNNDCYEIIDDEDRKNIFVAKAYDLARFGNELETRKILDDFLAFCKKHTINLTLQ